MSIAEVVFCSSASVVAYIYAGYPALLALWARLAARPWRPAADGRLPSVSVVVAARNEGACLEARLENLLSQDYPESLREIIVVSDGSTDDTVVRLAPYGRRIRLIELPAGGKAAALNRAVEAAANDIIVFADARQRFARDSVRQLVRPFGDPTVGAATGELVLDVETGRPQASNAHPSSVGEGVGLYWTYEKWLRRRESLVASTVGATGAIWAIRKSLWRPLPLDTLLDDVLAPLRVVLGGHRVVFVPEALAFDRAASDAATEQRRKVRTLAGNYQLLWQEPRLLSPFHNPVWLPFVSHKLGRLVVPYALVGLLMSSMALAAEHLVFGIALAVQTAFYVLALHGATLAMDRPPATSDNRVDGGRSEGSSSAEYVNAQAD